MARVRSYTAKANRGKGVETFMNNYVAISQKQARERKKSEEQAKKRSARESERRRARERREREDRERREKREAERQAREQEKLDKQMTAIVERVLLDLEKIGLYPSKSVANEIAKKATKASVTPAKAKSYFIDGQENQLAESCGQSYLNSTLGIQGRFNSTSEFKRLVELVKESRPQKDASKLPEFAGLKKKLKIKFDEQIQFEGRQSERTALIEQLITNKTMFKYEIEEFSEIIEKNDWTAEESKKSQEFKDRFSKKQQYIAELKKQLRPFTL